MPEFNNAKIKFEGNESKCVVTFNGSPEFDKLF